MGYSVWIGICIACRGIFQFNPHRVPSLRIDGARHAICRSCAERWIALHPAADVRILPGAYDPEPDDSGEAWEPEP